MSSVVFIVTSASSKPNKRAVPVLAVDAMGGDSAPEVVVEALERFLQQTEGMCRLLLFGTEKVRTLVEKNTLLKQCSEVRITKDVLGGGEKPTEVLRKSRDYSMMRAVRAVADGEADIVLSAGNTGGYVVACKVVFGTFKSVARPGLVAFLLCDNKRLAAIVDVGANLSVTPKLLTQHAVMAAALLRIVASTKRVFSAGVVNLGTEDGKGYKDLHDVREILGKVPSVFGSAQFVEPHKILLGAADVLVTDGFTGNIIIKSMKGAARYVQRAMRNLAHRSLMNKMLSLLLKPFFAQLKKLLYAKEHSAALLLGVKHPAVKVHGDCDVQAFSAGASMAYRLVHFDAKRRMSENLTALSKVWAREEKKVVSETFSVKQKATESQKKS